MGADAKATCTGKHELRRFIPWSCPFYVSFLILSSDSKQHKKATQRHVKNLKISFHPPRKRQEFSHFWLNLKPRAGTGAATMWRLQPKKGGSPTLFERSRSRPIMTGVEPPVIAGVEPPCFQRSWSRPASPGVRAALFWHWWLSESNNVSCF